MMNSNAMTNFKKDISDDGSFDVPYNISHFIGRIQLKDEIIIDGNWILIGFVAVAKIIDGVTTFQAYKLIDQ